MMSIRWCGTCASSSGLGLAVPMSMPRYTSAESSDTISTRCRSATLSASADLPLAVGPRSAYAVRANLAPAGDVEQRAGDVRGLGRGEPEDGAGHFLGIAAALQRRAGADALDAPWIAAGGVDLGADHAGSHGVHADAFSADFLRQADREAVDRAFRRRVVHVVARAAELCRHRGHVDDGAALAAVLRRHALHRLARAQEAASDVDREHALDALGGQVLDARAAVDDAGVVHQHVEVTQLVVDGLEQAHYVGFDRHVALDRDRVVTELLGQLVRRALIRPIVHAYAVAAFCRQPRGGGADAAAAAGDEHDGAHRPRRNSLSRSPSVS